MTAKVACVAWNGSSLEKVCLVWKGVTSVNKEAISGLV